MTGGSFICMEEITKKPSPSLLLECWLEIVRPWQAVFAQKRTWVRAARQALGSLLVLGRATVSRILWTSGREQKAWSGEYFLHSRARWDPHALFTPLLTEGLAFCPGKLVGVAVDDTRLRKTGRSIPQAAWHRDPMSPAFHTNLMLGLRFLQASLLLPLHRNGLFSARAIPIRFEEVSTVKKPGKRANEEAWEQYKADRKRFNLSQRFVETMAQLRAALDEAGGQSKTLVIAGDGSFCNRTVLAAIPQRAILIARTRKDIRLCFAAVPGGRRIYAAENSLPSRYAKMKRSSGKPPNFSMAASDAGSAIKKSLRFCGKAEQRPAFAPVRHRPYALSQAQVLQTLLPSTRFLIVHGSTQFGSPTPTDLLRPLAD